MNRSWLLFLLCLSLLLLTFVPLTRARGEFRVDEARTRVFLREGPARVLLAVKNLTGERTTVEVALELLDPKDRVVAQVSTPQVIDSGDKTVTQSLPFSVTDLSEDERSQLLWYRLRYRVSAEGARNLISSGIISLSEITPDLFEIRIATSGLAREGSRYLARVLASHPATHQPTANVLIDAEVTLEDDDERTVKLSASKKTDAEGYAVMEFDLPPRFPQFPHHLLPAGGEIHVIGRKGAIEAEVTGQVLVDQFVKSFITTDKRLYQPGQVLHVRALMFTPSRQALANQDIAIRVVDPDDLTVFREVIKSSEFGVVATDWTIPENVRLGDYSISVGIEGGDESDQATDAVRISRYELPNFSVKVQTDREYYLPGQNAEVRVSADYLFGRPVSRGQVRVVREEERTWNYREQKWEVRESEELKGESNGDGVFIAQLDLSDANEDLNSYDNQRYADLTYAAYFTDPTTNRTEQRRFDMRVTKEPIHVYIIKDYDVNPALPLRFFVSTSYADGSPARCKVQVDLSRESRYPNQTQADLVTERLMTLSTNQYGLAKGVVRLPKGFTGEGDFVLTAAATDAQQRNGSRTESMDLDGDAPLFVETKKSLYRVGEPLEVALTATRSDATVVVDVASQSRLISTRRVRLQNGKGAVVFPYERGFKDKLTVAAYLDFPGEDNTVSSRAILYTGTNELKVKARASQRIYRPGESAQVMLNVTAPGRRSSQSALGVVVLDKAVEERMRTNQDFGGGSNGNYDAVGEFLGLEQVAGVTLRDLRNLDRRKTDSPALNLLAEILLNQDSSYYRQFYGNERYETEPAKVFVDLIRKQIRPLRDALSNTYTQTGAYPRSRDDLRRLLTGTELDLDKLVDPWGTPYQFSFSVQGEMDVLMLFSAGADKRFDTADDFSVDQMSWRYFLPLGGAIDRAVQGYHKRTNRFITDFVTLREELERSEGIALDQLRDRWDQPYRFEFQIKKHHYLIQVRSSGPDRKFGDEKSIVGDDLMMWASAIDYFAEPRAKLEAAMDQHFKIKKEIPQSLPELRAALRDSASLLDQIHDPWGHAYYAKFGTLSFDADKVQLERVKKFGDPDTKTIITPIFRTVGIINLQSAGPDGKPGNDDDFTVAAFTQLQKEGPRASTEFRKIAAELILAGNNGAIYGVVQDSTGAAIPGVRVTATKTLEEPRYETVTNDEGSYWLTHLPSGSYEVRFDALGFKAYIITNVLVSYSTLRSVNAVLEPGTVSETVTISGGSSFLDMQTSFSVGERRSKLDRSFKVVTKSGGAAVATPRLREYFPETLLWQPSIETDKQGRAQIKFPLADNITTWKLAVIGSTRDGQIGTTETEIRSFQPFFVEHDPPRVLTEGDEISLPVVVRNYLPRKQNVSLEVKPESWFSLLGPERKSAAVAAGAATRETFRFRAVSSIDNAQQRVTATTVGVADAIQKPITVHPDGQELSATATEILASSARLQLDLPESVIRNSTRAELKIYPNLMAHVVESVEAIMTRPHGCGEQTISSTYPSLLLLRHLKRSGSESPLRARAERYLALGYSRLLSYRASEGGFTYWGQGEADVALTAYALRFLNDAAEVMPVEPSIANDASQWLNSKQRPDGSWPGQISLTTYVAHALAMTEAESNSTSDALRRALEYLSRQAEGFDEPYSLASYALAALEGHDTERAKPIIKKLRSLAITEGDTVHWSMDSVTPFYGWGNTGRIETTALVVQALSRACENNCEVDQKLINRGVLYLLRKKDQYGVWLSTQATINVLKALLNLAKPQKGSTQLQATAEIVVNGRKVEKVAIPANVTGVMNPITVDFSSYISAGRNSILINRANGSAFASVQLVASYYVPWLDTPVSNDANALRLRTKFDRTEARVSDEVTCSVEVERVGSAGFGMMIAEIGLPPGADVDRQTLEQAMTGQNWNVSQYEILPDRVVLYIWPRAGGVKFDFKFRPRFGLNAKAAASVLYDYYNPEARVVLAPQRFKFSE